jgi:hypothetical protein
MIDVEVVDPDNRIFQDVDVDVMDMPRYKTAAELVASIANEQQDYVKVYKLSLLHTTTNKPTNSQFLILFDKLEGRARILHTICVHMRLYHSLRCSFQTFWGCASLDNHRYVS